MENKIKARDRKETYTAVLMIAVFVCLLLFMPQVWAKTGAAIIMLNCVQVIFRLHRARKVRVRQDASSEIKHHLEVSLQRVWQQITLLNSVLWWYLLPFFAGVLCFYYAISHSLISKVLYTSAVITGYGYIWYLN